jgi:hypothetical protein
MLCFYKFILNLVYRLIRAVRYLAASLLKSLMVILFVMASLGADGQSQRITYSAGNTLFTEVLDDLTRQYGLRFAYDASAFEGAHVTFSVENQTAEQVIKLLGEKYPVRFRKLEGTWMVTRIQDAGNRREEPPVAAGPAPQPVKPAGRIVSGYVTDAFSGEPLVYCNIITGNQRGTVTNHLGYFQIETNERELPFYISHLGYQRLDTIAIPAAAMPMKIALQPFIILMEEVSVTRKEKSILESGEYSEKIGFNPAQSAHMPRLSNDDLANMLTLIPGVNLLGGAGGGLSIRGGDPSENLVLLDGIPLLETGHMLGNVSVLNASFIRQAFVSRGGFDAASGDRAAGLVELTGRSGPLTHPTIDVSANLMNGNVVANIPLAKVFSLTGAWRRSYIDQWQNHLSEKIIKESRLTQPGEYDLEVFPAVWYDDINLKASLFPSGNQMLTLGFLQGKDFQLLDYETGEKQVLYRNEIAESLNRGYSLSWSLQSGQWNHSLVAGYSQLHQQRKHESGRQINVVQGNQKPKKNPKANPNPNAGSSNRNKYETDNDSNVVREFRIDWRTDLKTGIFTHQVGAGFVENAFSFDYYAARSQGNTPVDSLSSSLRQSIGHIFIQQVIEPADAFRIRYGLRVNYNQAFSQLYVQPRGGIEYTPVEGVKAYYHSGVYRQFLSRIPRVDSFGNADMVWFLPDSAGTGVLNSLHHVLGFRLEKGGFLVNAELYSRNTEGRQWLFAQQYRKANVNRIHYVTLSGEEKNRGLDLFAQFRHGNFTHQAAWSLSDSKEKMSGFYNDEWYPSLNHHRHQVQINEMFSYQGWVLSAGWAYRSGQPRITISDSGEYIFRRMDYFSQLDIGLVKTIRLGKFAASGGASLLNVLNRTNIVEVDYLNISTESGGYSLQTNISAMPFMPVFFVRMQVL